MFDESKHPRDDGGKFTDKGGGSREDYTQSVNDRIKWAKENGVDLPLNTDGSVDDLKLQELYEKGKDKKKMTPAEKIASVHIDFTKDNILPELDESSLKEMGVSESKPVLVKASSIVLNNEKHGDVNPADVDELIGRTLYEPDKIVPGKNANKPYYSFLKELRISRKNGKPIYGAVLLDVSSENKNFEVVHWHWVKLKNLSSVLPKQ